MKRNIITGTLCETLRLCDFLKNISKLYQQIFPKDNLLSILEPFFRYVYVSLPDCKLRNLLMEIDLIEFSSITHLLRLTTIIKIVAYWVVIGNKRKSETTIRKLILVIIHVPVEMRALPTISNFVMNSIDDNVNNILHGRNFTLLIILQRHIHLLGENMYFEIIQYRTSTNSV